VEVNLCLSLVFGVCSLLLKGSLNDDKLKKKVPRPQNIRMLALCTKSSSAAVDASFVISQIIAVT
jgi:hypothetical protein